MLIERFLGWLGYPVSMRRLLKARPDIVVILDRERPGIDLGSVVGWNDLWRHRKGGGYIFGWRQHEMRYRGCLIYRPEIERVVQCDIIQNWECNIDDIHGFAGSKSKLSHFIDTDDMVEADSPELIEEISDAKLKDNLDHYGIGIIHKPGHDFFVRHTWDRRVFLVNSDGSHHLAAAKYIARRLGSPVKLTGALHFYSLHKPSIASLTRDFEMFVIVNEPELWNSFLMAMESYRATWFWLSMPSPYRDAMTVLLPKNEVRSMRIAAEFRAFGVADFGKYLRVIANL